MSPILLERRELRTAEQHLPNDILFSLVVRAALPDDGHRCFTFAEVERHRGVRVAALPNPNAAERLEAVRAFAPDLVLTIRYGAILKAPVIAVPRLGILNLHSGLLPAYRGVLATFRALMKGDTHIGCTAHYIADGTIDTGPVLGDARLPVVPGRSLLWHVLTLYEPGVAMLASAVDRLEGGAVLPCSSQPASGGAYYSYPTAADWAAFTRAGWTVAQPSDFVDLSRRYLPAAT